MERSKKDCILAEAAKAFSRFGFKKASVDDIAKKAGVGKGTVYLAAESKEDLYYQAVHREVRAWIAQCGTLLDRRTPADELMTVLLTAATEYLKDRPLVRELLFGEIQQSLPVWAKRFDELRMLGRANLIEVLRLGIEQKLFRPDIEVETVAELLQDLSIAAQRFVLGRAASKGELEHRTAVGVDLVLNGLRSPSAAHRHPTAAT